jgi:hypothetical protein
MVGQASEVDERSKASSILAWYSHRYRAPLGHCSSGMQEIPAIEESIQCVVVNCRMSAEEMLDASR